MVIDNTPVTAALVMDRSKMLGNSEGADDRGRLHVKVANKNTESIPVTITDSVAGTPFYLDYAQTPSGAGPHTLFSFTVASATRSLTQLYISCRIESEITVYKNGSVIGSLRTGAAMPMAKFDWLPARDCVLGDLIEVILMKRANSPDVDINAHFMGVDQ